MRAMLFHFSIESFSSLSRAPSISPLGRALSALATHAPPPRRRPAAAAAAAAAAFNVEPFQVSQQETGAAAGAPSTSSAGDLRARAAAAQTSASLSADDEFHHRSSSRDSRSRSRGRLPTTSETSSRHRSLSQQRRNRRRNSNQSGPAATVLEGFQDAWETIMSGGIRNVPQRGHVADAGALCSFFFRVLS